ncbi:MAG: FAD-dependent monooxygenase, partial [Bacteroidota bacterium]|nr:FAD-dependent monooxygenase [Bacteroidota bacterium]MDX5429428.1 FAD-dependent monooxygenase [Bacteroidota bacterium]MDX5468219.1 FAD-dependent monooxygenase [Bacteroidota bacterium]
VMSRMDLDHFILNEGKLKGDVTVYEGCQVEKIGEERKVLKLSTSLGDFHTQMVIGADGNHSIVAKELAGRNGIDKNHHCAALRQYYKNVDWPQGNHHIDIFAIEDTMPGYLWVFPMSDNRANVGIGMLSQKLSKNKVNLKKVLENALATHPELAGRFKDAEPIESVKGFGIPIGSKRYSLSGNRFLLVGDAACLVDPISGEGIANAIRSGRFAAEYASKAIAEGRFDAKYLRAYDRKIYELIGDELRLSAFFQRVFLRKSIFNWTVRYVKRHPKSLDRIRRVFLETSFFNQWSKPGFYFKQRVKK